MTETPIDDHDGEWLAQFWASLPSRVQWPSLSPDPMVLARMKLDFSTGRYSEDDPYPRVPYENAGFRLPAPEPHDWDLGG